MNPLTPKNMRFEPHSVYHIYNRGNNKQPIFFSEANYLFFFGKLQKHITPHADILCWCLMPNHFHLMVYATEKSCKESYGSIKLKIQALSYWIGIIQSSYAQAINKQNGTTGSLFQCKTKAKSLSEKEDIIRCLHYIHQNPLKAGLVWHLHEWQFSSFKDYEGTRDTMLCNQALLYSLTGCNKTSLLENSNQQISFSESLF
jgi:putative transposase